MIADVEKQKGHLHLDICHFPRAQTFAFQGQPISTLCFVSRWHRHLSLIGAKVPPTSGPCILFMHFSGVQGPHTCILRTDHPIFRGARLI